MFISLHLSPLIGHLYSVHSLYFMLSYFFFTVFFWSIWITFRNLFYLLSLYLFVLLIFIYSTRNHHIHSYFFTIYLYVPSHVIFRKIVTISVYWLTSFFRLQLFYVFYRYTSKTPQRCYKFASNGCTYFK